MTSFQNEKWVKLSTFGRYQQMPVNDEVAILSQTFEADIGEWKRDMAFFLQQLELVLYAEYHE